MKLLGLLLIRCVFTKKPEGAKKDRKFVKIGTGKNIGFPEQCALLTGPKTPKFQFLFPRKRSLRDYNDFASCPLKNDDVI